MLLLVVIAVFTDDAVVAADANDSNHTFILLVLAMNRHPIVIFLFCEKFLQKLNFIRFNGRCAYKMHTFLPFAAFQVVNTPLYDTYHVSFCAL